MIAMPAVACGTNRCSRPSASSATNRSHSGVRSCTTSFLPVRTAIVSLRKALLDLLDLGAELSVVPRTDVGFKHEADARGRRGDDVDGLLDHRHHLVPLPLDVGEHRVGLAGETGRTHHADGLGDRLADAAVLVAGGRTDAEGHDHGASLARSGGTLRRWC